MMKAVLAALLSAAAVVPVVAVAQDASLREALRQRMEARGGPERVRVQNETRVQGGGWQQRERAERPARVERPERIERAERADRVERQERRGGDAGLGGRVDAGAQAERAQAGGWQRRDRRDDRDGGPAGGWQRPDRPSGDAVPQRANRDPRDGRPLWTERNWRGDDRHAGRDRERDRQARRGRDWNDGRNWNGNDAWRAGSWNDRDDRGGQWNRGWRTDRRYDWNRYRTANRSAYRLPRYYAPYGWDRGYRRFAIGVRLSSVLFAQDYWLDDPYSYRLPEPYGPYRWVRYYDDALLVDVYTGQVVDAVYGVFW